LILDWALVRCTVADPTPVPLEWKHVSLTEPWFADHFPGLDPY